MLGQIRDLINVCGPDCFVHRKKNKIKCHSHNIRHVCTLQFFSVFDNMFAMLLLQQLLVLHDSCDIWFHVSCCYTLIASTIFKNHVYLTNHWLDSRDVVEIYTSRPRLLQKVQDSKICRLCRNVSTNFQKIVITTSKLKFCEFSVFLILAYVILTCRYSRQNVRWIEEVSLSRIVAVFKVSRQ